VICVCRIKINIAYIHTYTLPRKTGLNNFANNVFIQRFIIIFPKTLNAFLLLQWKLLHPCRGGGYSYSSLVIKPPDHTMCPWPRV